MDYNVDDLIVRMEDGPSFDIFTIVSLIMNVGIPVACATPIGELLAMLKLPNEVIGLVRMAKGMVCRGL